MSKRADRDGYVVADNPGSQSTGDKVRPGHRCHTGGKLHAQREVGPLENAQPGLQGTQHYPLEAVPVHVFDQCLDEGRKLPVGILPDHNSAILEFVLKLLV
jgi:hypothetical protein